MTKPNPSRSSKSGRLLRFSGEAAFRHHRRSAQRFEETGFTAFVTLPVDNAWRFAVVASKSRIGSAVERNRAKRRLRAAFNEARKTGSPPVAVVLYAKKAVLAADMPKLVSTLSNIFHAMASR